MPGQMFGAPIGESQAMDDIRQRQLADLALSEGSVKLQEAQVTLESQKSMLAMMQQGGIMPQTGGQPQQPQQPSTADANDKAYDLAGMMDKLAVMSAASGMPEKAREYATAGSTLRHQSDQNADTDFKEKIKHLDYIGTLMQNVHDEQSWKQANAMYQMTMGQPTPYAQMPYNPTVVEELKAGVATAKDRATTAAQEALKISRQSATDERNARIPLIRAQTALANERTDHLRKSGAVGLIPKAGDVKAITDLITKDYPSAMPEDARVRARPIAEDVLRIQRTTNLTQSQAVEKAYQNAKSAGAFGGLRPGVAMSGTLDKPMDLPADYSKLKKNMFYKGKGNFANKVLLWTGSGFVPVGTGPGEIQVPKDEEVTEEGGDETDEEETNPDDELPAKEP